ncbi:MAG: hypothetical protein V1929_07700 [bacterium]
MSARKKAMVLIAGVMVFMAHRSEAVWVPVLADDFSTNGWSYAGVSNGLGQALLRYDAGQQRVLAEWNQGNHFDGSGDPQVINNSRLTIPLGRTLTDEDSFRFGATLKITAGSIPNTLEFYQLAIFGLYNLAPDVIGADRLQSDNYSGNTTLVRDANNLIEFNYFINNESYGFNPFVQGIAITRMPTGEVDSTAYFVTGTGSDPFFHDTDMGAWNYLPTDSNLYVEVMYFGRATNSYARRVFMGIYTDPTRTNLLTVNGVQMFYWTKAVPADRTFDVDTFAFFNYAGVNFTVLYGGNTPNGAGAGSFDDVYVELYRELRELHAATLDASSGMVLTWATEPGTNYFVLATTNLLTGPWTTTCVLQATGPLATFTNSLTGSQGIYGIGQ